RARLPIPPLALVALTTRQCGAWATGKGSTQGWPVRRPRRAAAWIRSCFPIASSTGPPRRGRRADGGREAGPGDADSECGHTRTPTQEGTMSALHRFEERLERVVTGVFARAFRSAVQPMEIAAALQREVDNSAQILSRDKRLAPNDFIID